jgi:hypothetical protein
VSLRIWLLVAQVQSISRVGRFVTGEERPVLSKRVSSKVVSKESLVVITHVTDLVEDSARLTVRSMFDIDLFNLRRTISRIVGQAQITSR